MQTCTNDSCWKKSWTQRNVDSGKTVSRRRSNRQDVRFAGGATAAALSQALPPSARRCSEFDPRAEPAGRVATEVHAVCNRLVHPAAPDQRADVARRPLSGLAGSNSNLLVLSGDFS